MSGLQWALVNEEKGYPTSTPLKKNREYNLSNGSSSTTTSSPRSITRGKSPVDGGARHSSAPLEVPDWSKIYGNKRANVEDYQSDDVVDDVDDDHNGKIIPPHDYIAKRLAKAKISSFSMCEGNGRTLKGRDLRKVRNEVLTKTGFLE